MYTPQIIVLTFILLIILHIRLPKSRLVNIYLLCTWILLLLSIYISFNEMPVNIGLLLVPLIYTILSVYYVEIKNKVDKRISIIIIILLWFIYFSLLIKNKKNVMKHTPFIAGNEIPLNVLVNKRRVKTTLCTNDRVSEVKPVDTENLQFISTVGNRLRTNINSELNQDEYDKLLSIFSKTEPAIKTEIKEIFDINNLNKGHQTDVFLDKYKY